MEGSGIRVLVNVISEYYAATGMHLVSDGVLTLGDGGDMVTSRVWRHFALTPSLARCNLSGHT